LATTTGRSGRTKKGSGSRSQKARKSAHLSEAKKIDGGIKSLINSPLFRNVVAAGLAAAAAALVSRGSSSSNDLDAEAPGGDGALDGSPVDAKPSSLTAKVNRRTKAGKTAVVEAAEAVSLGSAGAQVAKKAKKVAKATKAALTGADAGSGVAGSDHGIEPPVQPRTRKVRSDAGRRRKPKVEVADPGPLPIADLPLPPRTETSTLALSAAVIPEADDKPELSEEQGTKIYPS
jgi:hypothetical protein